MKFNKRTILAVKKLRFKPKKLAFPKRKSQLFFIAYFLTFEDVQAPYHSLFLIVLIAQEMDD